MRDQGRRRIQNVVWLSIDRVRAGGRKSGRRAASRRWRPRAAALDRSLLKAPGAPGTPIPPWPPDHHTTWGCPRQRDERHPVFDCAAHDHTWGCPSSRPCSGRPIVLGVVFFGLFTPIAMLMRIIGRDELRLKFSHKVSHWITRSEPITSESFKQQF